MKNNLTTKLILILSLISVCLSMGVMSGRYTKDTYASRDDKFYKAFAAVNNKIVSRCKGIAVCNVYPIAVYRQIANGVNYKFISAVRDEKKKRVNFVDSVVYTGPFQNNFLEISPTITYQAKLPNKFNLENDIYGIENFIYENVESTDTSIYAINSIVNCPNVVSDESFYLVDTYIIEKENPLIRYFILSLDVDNGLKIIHTFDFPKEN